MIGIAGGVGPVAGLDLFKKIIEETDAKKDQDHIPVVLLSLPGYIPDRTKYLLGEEKENPAYALSNVIVMLERAGAGVAAIPCNTAHAAPIFDVISAELSKRKCEIKLLHLIHETVKHILRSYPRKTVGILSTTGTRLTGVYSQSLRNAGISITEPDDEWQQRVHSAIYDERYGIKSKPFNEDNLARRELTGAMMQLKHQGAEVIILGCTEIPLVITESTYDGIPLVDPGRILARALIKAAKQRS